jgi:hypothetical protein
MGNFYAVLSFPIQTHPAISILLKRIFLMLRARSRKSQLKTGRPDKPAKSRLRPWSSGTGRGRRTFWRDGTNFTHVVFSSAKNKKWLKDCLFLVVSNV